MLIKRSVTIQGHRTSVALEPEFWAALEAAAEADKLSVTAWITRLDEARQTPLASAIRVELLRRAAKGSAPGYQ